MKPIRTGESIIYLYVLLSFVPSGYFYMIWIVLLIKYLLEIMKLKRFHKHFFPLY